MATANSGFKHSAIIAPQIDDLRGYIVFHNSDSQLSKRYLLKSYVNQWVVKLVFVIEKFLGNYGEPSV